MTKELKLFEGDNDSSKQTVSTDSDISEITGQNKSLIPDSNINDNINESVDSSKVQHSKESENQEINISFDKMSNGVQNENNKEEIKESSEEGKEAEEEDVPGDFFDLFLTKDFMDGLDIVDDDSWDDQKEANTEGKADKGSKNVVQDEKKRKPKIDHVQRFRISPPGEKRNKPKKKKQDEKQIKQRDGKVKKSKQKIIDADEFDIRRDPEKTKRDIQRDKARCEKDKEKKIISEKLSFVETGLVPPGMEMEIDLDEVKKQRIELNKPPRDLREVLKNRRSKSKSPHQKTKSPPKAESKKTDSPVKRTSPKRRRTRSPLKKSPRPLQRRSPRRSPIRRNSPRRSPLRSPRHRSRERRRSRSISPYYRNRRNRYSPSHPRYRHRSSSRGSPRELWLQGRRSRSRSLRRKREEKKSFLQEIAEKLNETRPPVTVMPQMQQMHFVQLPQPVPPVPTPAPVPAPGDNLYFDPRPQPHPPHPQPLLQPQPHLLPQQPHPPQPHPHLQPHPTFSSQHSQQYDPYDQNFFIGAQSPVVPPHFIEQQKPGSLPIPQTPLMSGSDPTRGGSTIENVPQIPRETVPGPKEKLFQDKKITLSEFLAITAKPEVSSSNPAHLQEKIKVISRCQEAIKFLGGNEKKFSGKLIVQHTNDYKVLNEKYRSPLLKNPPVVFPFTQKQMKKVDQKTTFTNFINQLLQKLGLMKEVVVEVDKIEPADTGISPSPQVHAPPPPPVITSPNNNPYNPVRASRFINPVSNRSSTMVQTDIFKCEDCEKRKRVLYKVSGVQCGGVSTMFSVSTQVTENDFLPKISSTQSLASLTPAQLLAKSRSSLDGSSIPNKYGRNLDNDDFDVTPPTNNYNYFPRSGENYGMSRYSPPSSGLPHNYMLSPREELLPSLYGSNVNPRSQFLGGGGRGRVPPPNPPRPLMDLSSRYGYWK